MKHFVWLAVLVCAVPWMEVNSQAVVQQCLAEQIRNIRNNNNNNNLNQQETVEQATFTAFQAICRNYPEYIRCLQTRLPGSTDVPDVFLSLLFQPQSMTVAYRGLCQNLNVIQQNIRCLLSTPEVRRCYDNFNEDVRRVVNLQTQGLVPQTTLQELACNVSVARYRCETELYGLCNEESGQIMQNFFNAGVPQECRDVTGTTSRFVQLEGGAASLTVSRSLHRVISLLTVLGAIWL